MGANKNAFKIGLRVSAAIALLYFIYSLTPGLRTSPVSHQHDADYDGFVKDSVHMAAAAGHIHSAATPTFALHTEASPMKALPTTSRWTSYNDTSLPTLIKHLYTTNIDVTTSPSLLVCIMTKDDSSWGSSTRNFSSFLNMLELTELNISTISLACLTSSAEEFEIYRANTLNTSYASVHLIEHPGYKDVGGSRGFRHSSSIQHSRRVEMARLRNYATLTSLRLSHQHVLWIDSDVYELSTGLIQNMLNYSSMYPQVGIQTAISFLGDSDKDYDRNAWKGERSTPDDKEREKLRKDKDSWGANSVNGRSKHMGDLREEFKKTRDEQKEFNHPDSDTDFENGGALNPSKAVYDDADEEEPADSQLLATIESPDDLPGLLRLDSVGATVLMIRASLWRQGLAFATSYLVGTDWQDEGWDGVESEGLCVTARNLINEEYGRQGGVGCWGVAEGFSRHSNG